MAPPKKTHCIRGHERTPENVNKQSMCKLCKKIHKQTPKYKASAKAYRQKPECKAREKDRRQTPEYKDYAKAYDQRPRRKKIIENLNNSYVANLLGISVHDAPAELLEIKRLTIQLQRSLKNGNQSKREDHDNRSNSQCAC